MKKILKLAAVLAACFIFFKLEPIATISSVSLPYRIDTADTPKVAWVDANDSALRVGLNLAIDTVNTYLNNGVIAQIFKTNTNARMTIDADANGTGHRFAITNNGSTDTIASFRDDSSTKVFGRLHVVDSVLGATARFTGTVRADSLRTGTNEKFGYDTAYFTATLTGVSGTVQATASYVRVGSMVTVFIPQLTGTSTSTSCAISGLPASISPPTASVLGTLPIVDNTSSYAVGVWTIAATSTNIVLGNGLNSSSFTNWTDSGTKGIEVGNVQLHYMLR
jgi:hypothetical protein